MIQFESFLLYSEEINKLTKTGMKVFKKYNSNEVDLDLSLKQSLNTEFDLN